jgi:MFS family permease
MQGTGQFSGGWLGDRLSKRWICAACMLGHAAALLVLAFASSYGMVLAFAVLQGLSWGMRGPLMAANRADYFGAASFGAITGVSSMVVMFGMILGPLVAGVLADRTSSYVPGFSVLAAFAALGSVAFARARRPGLPVDGRGALSPVRSS